MFENALQQSAHRHQLETANVQADDADERRGLGFLLQDEYPHIVQPQFGGQHRTGRPAPGNDHVEHEGRAIGESRRVHRCCLSGVPCWRGAPGDTYVNRPAVTGRGSTHIDTAFMGLTSSGGVTVNCKLQARASPRPTLSQPRDHDSEVHHRGEQGRAGPPARGGDAEAHSGRLPATPTRSFAARFSTRTGWSLWSYCRSFIASVV